MNCTLYFIDSVDVDGAMNVWHDFPNVGILGDINSLLIKFFMRGVSECIAEKEAELLQASLDGNLEAELNSDFSIDFSFNKVKRLSETLGQRMFISDDNVWMLKPCDSDIEIVTNVTMSVGKFSFVDLLHFEGSNVTGLIVKPFDSDKFLEDYRNNLYHNLFVTHSRGSSTCTYQIAEEGENEDYGRVSKHKSRRNPKTIAENFEKIIEETNDEDNTLRSEEEDIEPQRQKKKSKKHRESKKRERRWADIEDDE